MEAGTTDWTTVTRSSRSSRTVPLTPKAKLNPKAKAAKAPAVLAPKLDTHNRFAVLGAPDYEEEDEDEAKYQDKAELQEQDAGKEGARLGDLEIPEVPRKQAAEVDTALKVHLALSLSPRFSLAVSLSHTRPSLSLPLDVYRLMSRVLSLARSLACSRKLSLLYLSLSLSLSLS